MRLDDLVQVASWLKSVHPNIPIRINTNGLSDLVFGEPTAQRLEGIVDTVSISLNSSDAQKYVDITRNRFGLASYQAMLDFAKDCQKYVKTVVMTVVDIIGEEEVAACQRVCDEHGLTLRYARMRQTDQTAAHIFLRKADTTSVRRFFLWEKIVGRNVMALPKRARAGVIPGGQGRPGPVQTPPVKES